mmetsp:Transcript_5612/g.12154  ORF Transcript_5612/g.12154 Transcript_5612/m.12154 type:complete len:99 (-) Transcript_5612:378-674(-)
MRFTPRLPLCRGTRAAKKAKKDKKDKKKEEKAAQQAAQKTAEQESSRAARQAKRGTLSRTHLRIPIPLRAAEQQPRADVQLPSRLLKEPCSNRTAADL